MAATKPMAKIPAMTKVRTATVLFGFDMINVFGHMLRRRRAEGYARSAAQKASGCTSAAGPGSNPETRATWCALKPPR